MNDATNITPQVQKKMGHGIPRLLPGLGESPTAGRKKIQATTAALRASLKLGFRIDGS
jgi:hypothetical protein